MKNFIFLYVLFSQMRLLEECRGSIDAVKRVGFSLKDDEDTASGLADPNSSESQTSGKVVFECSIIIFSNA